jgi:hypothetical protein
MKNRCVNTGLTAGKDFLTIDDSVNLRKEVDHYLDKKIELWNKTVPYAQHFEGETIHKPYYIRHLIETIWRIRLLRVSDARALSEIAKISPKAAQIWANYEMEEMIHDELFFQDLQKQEVSREDVLKIEPYLSTKLLTGYFFYLLEHEGPLGIVVYSYLVEHVNVCLEAKKLEKMEKNLGKDMIKGQLMHAHTDEHEDHPGEVWQVIRHLITSEDDIEKLYRYFDECQDILAMYFNEIYQDTVVKEEKKAA